jgi:NAD(P)-dependent dehydrogenase (short-subunit alcohol dehydrogenase family)
VTVVRNQFDLSGKVALVTGGAGILGRHFVKALLAHGAAVAVVDLDPGAAVDALVPVGGRLAGMACDITDREAFRTVADRVERELGPIDILHNSAATKGSDLAAFFAPTESYSETTWREVMSVNLDAMFFVAQEVGKRMVARRRGSIIQTSSIYGVFGPDQRIYEGSEYLGRPINTPPVYSTSKAGVIGLTKFLATTWAPYSVRVNALIPGGVESGQNEAFKTRYGNRVPMGRMAQPEEMTGPLIFLASDASSYVTGQNLLVDGGLSAW